MKKSNEHMTKHLKDSYESVKMSETTSASMRERLSAYADMHQVPVSSSSRLSPFNPFALPPFFRRTGALAALVFFVLGTGVTYASQSALPGDALYKVKLSVVEPVESFAYHKPEEVAVWRNVLVSRRLNEAKALVETNRLDEKREAEIALQVSLALDSSEEAIALVEAVGNVEVADSLRTSLKSELNSFSGEGEKEHVDVGDSQDKEKHASKLRALVMERALALEERDRSREGADTRSDEDEHKGEYAGEQRDQEGDAHATTLVKPQEATATSTKETPANEDSTLLDSTKEESSALPVSAPNPSTLGL